MDASALNWHLLIPLMAVSVGAMGVLLLEALLSRGESPSEATSGAAAASAAASCARKNLVPNQRTSG